MTKKLRLSPAQSQILSALEVPIWQLRKTALADVSTTEPAETGLQPAVSLLTDNGNIATVRDDSSKPELNKPAATAGIQAALNTEVCLASPTWLQLQQQIADCQNCELHQHRIEPVIGRGNKAADWFILGNAPTREDEQADDPFSGRPGLLLANMLLALGLSSEQVYLTNIVKCRPDQDRDPAGLEAKACGGHLNNQIELVQPKIILAMGRLAANYLLGEGQSVRAMRGQNFEFGSGHVPVVVTHHPADMQTAERKAEAWDDLQFARRRYNRQPLSE